MHHELLAKERQYMKDRIRDLEIQLKDMHSDFVECVNGALPCYHCAKCNNCYDHIGDCNFVWKPHN